MRLGGIFDYAEKRDRLEEVSRELEDPGVWSKPEQAQALGRERAQLEAIVGTLDKLQRGLGEAGDPVYHPPPRPLPDLWPHATLA